jgi:hypothetical protein
MGDETKLGNTFYSTTVAAYGTKDVVQEALSLNVQKAVVFNGVVLYPGSIVSLVKAVTEVRKAIDTIQSLDIDSEALDTKLLELCEYESILIDFIK